MGGSITLNKQSLKDVCAAGSYWPIANGYGWEEDSEFTEENGRLRGADPDKITDYAFKRGRNQLGTLGSGNHFLEIQKVQKIFDLETAKIFNLEEGMITVMIHSGSRGFGYQVCSDALQFMRKAPEKYVVAFSSLGIGTSDVSKVKLPTDDFIIKLYEEAKDVMEFPFNIKKVEALELPTGKFIKYKKD